MGFESQEQAEAWAEAAEFRADQLREERLLRSSPSLGIVAAVKQAVDHNTDNWRLYVARNAPKPGRFGGGKRPNWIDWIDEATHDQIDAAHMRLCLDANDTIRNIFLRGD